MVTWHSPFEVCHAPAYRFLSHLLLQATSPCTRLQKTLNTGSSKMSNSEQPATIVSMYSSY